VALQVQAGPWQTYGKADVTPLHSSTGRQGRSAGKQGNAMLDGQPSLYGNPGWGSGIVDPSYIRQQHT
jgi:predicted nicotinamide N-methyase